MDSVTSAFREPTLEADPQLRGAPVIHCIPSLFTGENGIALRKALQAFANDGVIIAELILQKLPAGQQWELTVRYVIEKELVLAQQFNPDDPNSFREHVADKVYSFKVTMRPFVVTLDVKQLLLKLALIRG